MKNDVSRRYYARIVMNIIYSAIITCLVEIFLVANISMLVRYLEEEGHQGRMIEAISGSQPLVVLIYVLFGILLFSGTLLFLQGPSIRYMNQISDAIQDLSEGNLNTTVEVVGDDEFSGMAANLNKMAEDIRRLMEKERESERTKNELITNVAHDLRTPLTSIIGYLELLERNPSLAPELQSKYIEIAYGKSKRLEKLIQDLFGFTKLNYGKIAMHVTQLDIVKLLGQLLEEAYPSFAQKGLSYDLQSNVPAKTITADGALLARLFDNLIGNAIKYGADGKRVLVQIRAEEEVVSVSVTNYGFVIPAEELPLIFNKFYRVEQSRSSSTGGTGLGLAIAKEIVESHGGTIRAESNGRLTSFVISLPLYREKKEERHGGKRSRADLSQPE